MPACLPAYGPLRSQVTWPPPPPSAPTLRLVRFWSKSPPCWAPRSTVTAEEIACRTCIRPSFADACASGARALPAGRLAVAAQGDRRQAAAVDRHPGRAAGHGAAALRLLCRCGGRLVPTGLDFPTRFCNSTDMNKRLWRTPSLSLQVTSTYCCPTWRLRTCWYRQACMGCLTRVAGWSSLCGGCCRLTPRTTE